MRFVDIIEKKKNKKELSKEEIKFFVKNYTNGNIPDYQASALLMAIVLNGMTLKEASILTEEMMYSGDIIDLSSIQGIKVDKHSTGGVGDKVSLVLGPIVSSCGAIFAKMSGRGLGHTGGTLDKLDSIPGFNCMLSDEEFKKMLNKSKIAIIGQTSKLVPADMKIYALRDVTATVQSMPLIASSVMSKKLATGSNAILLDVKVGSGAFMKTKKEAIELAKWMVQIGKKLKRDVKAEITNMEQPLGRMIGNKNEILEAVDSLKGNGEKQFMELIYSSAITLLKQAKIIKSDDQGKKMINEVIKSGKALDKFFEMISNQGGDIKAIQKSNWWNPKHSYEIKAWDNGYVYLKNSIEFGLTAMKLGAGRQTKEDVIDNEAGIELKKVSNEKVKKGETIVVLYSSKKIPSELAQNLEKMISISKEPKTIKTIIAKVE